MNPFTTINLDKLKEIAERWAAQFQRQGGQYNRITLHRYEAPLLTEDTSLRWAIAFDMTHYECQKMTREEALVNTVYDPYLYLLAHSNFPTWVNDRRQIAEEDVSTSKFEQAFLKQSGFSTPPRYVANQVDFPKYFMANDFPDVYTVGAPENWRHQWLFIPLFKGVDLPHQVHIEDAVIIFPNDGSRNDGKKQKGKGPDLKLFEKYVHLACEFMNKRKEQTGQAPLKDELLTYLEGVLKKNNETLGTRTRSVLPGAVFEELWKVVPIKRAIGEKTKPTRK